MIEKNEPQRISGYTSVILDSLRISAALTVFVYHFFYHWFRSFAFSHKMDALAHAAVIVFFVLSGYLIAYTTTITNRGGLKYLQARFSRLYSVVLPSLLITALCEILVNQISPVIHAEFSRGASWPRYIISGLFLNEIWFFSAAPPMNGPLWSLGYEFWYYVIFGLWFYKKSGYASYIFPAIACLIAGPKILIMMPIWLTGYFAYRFSRPNLKKSISWIIFTLSFILAILLIIYISPLPYKLGAPPLYFSSQFFTDWLIGFCIGLALWIMPKDKSSKKTNWTNLLRIAADLTFPLYVLHNPLLILWNAMYKSQIKNIIQLWQPIVSVLVMSVIIGIILEKYRFLWIKFFKYIFRHIGDR